MTEYMFLKQTNYSITSIREIFYRNTIGSFLNLSDKAQFVLPTLFRDSKSTHRVSINCKIMDAQKRYVYLKHNENKRSTRQKKTENKI